MKLKNYIQGNRKGKEANRIERDALTDPFLQDALEGFEAVDGDHFAAIEDLEQKVESRINSRKTRKLRYWHIISIAASFVIILGVSTLLLLKQPVQSPEITVADNAEKVTEVDTTERNIPAGALLKTDSQKAENSLVAKHEQIRKPKPVSPAPVLSPSEVANEIMITEDAEMESQAYFSQELSAMSDFSEEKIDAGNVVSGTILDETTGEPLIGVAIAAEGTNINTITDYNGKYELVLPDSDVTLTANYIGYLPVEVPLQAEASIEMEAGVVAMNDVVVGYGVQKKSELSNVTSERSATISDALSVTHFGEKEFLEYFDKNRTKNICEEDSVRLKAAFYIDSMGKPTNINITESACDELNNEFKRLLINTEWTVTDKQQKIEIK